MRRWNGKKSRAKNVAFRAEAKIALVERLFFAPDFLPKVRPRIELQPLDDK
jgi:hypothetical protein